MALAGFCGCGSGSLRPPFQITEVRQPCDNYQALRQPFFGETHVHTSYSFDAYVFSNRNDPNTAYQFAKGQPVPLPDVFAVGGTPQTRTAQINKPLDFTAVTDHSELFGEMQICTRSDPSTPGFNSLACRQMQTEQPNPAPGNPVDPLTVAGLWSLLPILLPDSAVPMPFCADPNVDCKSAAVSIWQEEQNAAEAAYDRSSACSFTSFVAYEYTAQPEYDNLHRNVIFRNANTVATPISNVETGGPFPPVLWDMLQKQCLDAGTGCDVLTIPHNANLSGSSEADPAGRMFPDPKDSREAANRRAFEPLVEILQHKAGSECRFDRLANQGVQTVDELCTFEQSPKDVLNPSAPSVPIDEFPTRNMLRNALKDGMALAPKFGGINPFKYGIVGSTDSHNGTPGNTAEPNWPGHAGTDDAPYARLISGVNRNPGGLAVVWAEENSRDAIFSAMRRKETYGTSGTRPIVRFFGGWNYDVTPEALCGNPNRVAVGYASGVPMGSDLPKRKGNANPRFLVAALKDSGSPSLAGTPLQRIQIIKGWVDSSGQTHEKVMDVAGTSSTSGNELNTDTCEPNYDAGFNELCSVFEDTEFDPSQPAFYYARVLENPTCRWSTYACKAAGVDPFLSEAQCTAKAAAANAQALADGEIEAGDAPFDNCCLNETNDSFLSRTIQERAWTSPIWYEPKS
ncbi:MAG: DUF3604 domain-containing protein [Deltaproteobacteria bacterium]|nr:DUF3604 domain-containing protein [Deltaproteobacteria bacterium]